MWLYVVVCPPGSAATTKVPRLSDDEVVRFEFETGTKLITFVPVTPVEPTSPDVLKTRLAATGMMTGSLGMAPAEAEPAIAAQTPRARANRRGPAHPKVVRIRFS